MKCASTVSPESTVLLRGLDRAARQVGAARRRDAWKLAFDRAAIFGSGSAIATAVALGAVRWYGMELTVPGVIAGLGGLICIAVFAFAMATALRTRSSIDEVAERLDLAARSHNAVATAMDLLRGTELSAWEQRAITDGLTAVKSINSLTPTLPPVRQFRRRVLLLPACSGVLLVGALLVPFNLASYPGANISPADASLLPQSHSSVIAPAPPKVSEQARMDSEVARSSGGAAKAGAHSRAGESGDASASAGSTSSGEPAGSVGRTAGFRSDQQQQDPQRGAGSPKAGQQSSALSDANALQTASFGSASPDAAQSNSPPAGSSGGSTAQSKQGGEKGGSGSGQAGSPSNSPSDKSQSGSGAGSGAGGKSSKDGQGSGKGMGSGDGTGKNGQSSGPSPVKKARGVAPLMLGSREPDFLQGRELPGPDERTQLQMPPQPGPESSSADATIPPREPAEPAVEDYQVAPAARATVQRYFDQYHQDADAAAPVSKSPSQTGNP
jgi:hypothetical protein